MRIALIAHDKPGALQVRKDNRDAHLAYIEKTGCVEMAGPILDAHGEMCGSLIILEVEDMSAARGWASGDPYAAADLFTSVEFHPWKKVIG